MQLNLSSPALEAYKSEAKTLRQDRTWDGRPVSHAEALELVAQNHGARDWNTLSAQAKKPVRLAPGMRVTGTYLGQPFTGTAKAVALWGPSAENLRVTLHFDQPVDVVTFDSFSSFRQRVTAVIGADGRSVAHTSDGTPHLALATAH